MLKKHLAFTSLKIPTISYSKNQRISAMHKESPLILLDELALLHSLLKPIKYHICKTYKSFKKYFESKNTPVNTDNIRHMERHA